MGTKQGATAQEIIDFLRECLEPEFGDMHLLISTGPRIGPHDSVFVKFASAVKGSPRLDIDNAKATPLFSIHAAEGQTWPHSQSSPVRLKVEQTGGAIYTGRKYSSPKLKMRSLSGNAEKVVEHLVKFFMGNKDVLRLGGE